MTDKQKIEALVGELSQVLAWATIEKSPLRSQEIASIRQTLAQIRDGGDDE